MRKGVKKGRRKKSSRRISTPGGQAKDDRLRPLEPMPPEALKLPGQAGFTAYHWIGSPWSLDGDALLVFTNEELVIHNRKFRGELLLKAGTGYRKEVASRKDPAPGRCV